MISITRRVLPIALAIGAALATPAAANHTPCAGAGGFLLTGVGPTNANICVFVGASGVMVGVDALHNCPSPATCSVAGARAEVIGTDPQVCSAIVIGGEWIFDGCVL